MIPWYLCALYQWDKKMWNPKNFVNSSPLRRIIHRLLFWMLWTWIWHAYVFFSVCTFLIPLVIKWGQIDNFFQLEKQIKKIMNLNKKGFRFHVSLNNGYRNRYWNLISKEESSYRQYGLSFNIKGPLKPILQPNFKCFQIISEDMGLVSSI